MGNEASQLTLWESLVETQLAQVTDCKSSSLINPETNQEYTIKHRQLNCYHATSSGRSYQVSLFKCPKFEQLSSAVLKAKELSLVDDNLLSKVVDFFAFKGRGTRALRLVVITDVTQAVTVEHWIAACKAKLQVDDVLRGFFEGVQMLMGFHRRGKALGVISVQNVCILARDNALSYTVKLLTDHLDLSQRPPEHNYRTQAADVWGAGVLLFTLLSGVPACESRLGRMSEVERLLYIRHTLGDLALSDLVAMCCSDLGRRKSCEEILGHLYVRWWMQPKAVDLRLELLQVLNTQLKCSSRQKTQTRAIKTIFALATLSPSTVFSFVTLQSIDWRMMTTVFIDHQLNFVEIEGALSLFIQAVKHNKGGRRLMLSSGITANLMKCRDSISFSPMIDFFRELCSSATCSVPVFLYENRVHLEVFKNYPICLNSQNFLLSCAPYFGLYSVNLILSAYQRRLLNCNQTIEMFLKLPFHNLILHKQTVLQLIETSISSLILSQFNFNSSLENALKLLSCITCIAEVFEHTSQRGSCLSSPEFSFALDLIRCPLVIFCGSCAIPVCVYCGATCHKSCKLRPLFPQSAFKFCRCNEEHYNEDKLQYPVFNIKRRTSCMFKTSNQAQVETLDADSYQVTCCSFNGQPVEVTSKETLVLPGTWERNSSTAFYYEAKVISSGVRDALSIGLEGLQYQSWNGQIVDIDAKMVRRCPPFGSHDTVGVGITYDSRAYFTLNGLMMHPLLPLDSDKLRLRFFSEDASVQLNFNPGRCTFQPQTASHMTDLRLRASLKIPRTLKAKLEKLLSENYTYFEGRNTLEDMLVFLSSQFSGQVGLSMLDRASKSHNWGAEKGIRGSCQLQ
jgi:hypothetical protein